MMKFLLNSVLLVGVFLLGSAFTNPETCADASTINIKESKIIWQGHKLTGTHTGSLDLKVGALDWENGKLTGGSFIVDMTSLTNHDLEGETKAKLEGHLRSDDFFSVDKYNTASFNITKVKEIPGKDMYTITGDMTIKGITNPVTFNAKITNSYATANVTIDRSKFDVRYGSNSFFDGLGDKAIYDEFDLNIELSLENI